MARITWHDHANLRLDGQLDAMLRRWQSEGMGIDQISRRLYAEHHLEVSRETVRRWLLDLRDPAPEPENAA